MDEHPGDQHMAWDAPIQVPATTSALFFSGIPSVVRFVAGSMTRVVQSIATATGVRRRKRWTFPDDFDGFDDLQGAPVPRIDSSPALSGAAAVPLPHAEGDPPGITYVLV
jgi:hypothetical protein